MITVTFRVEVENIIVTDAYYSFDYKLYQSGRLLTEDKYEEYDHAWRDDLEGLKKELEKGLAVQNVLVDCYEY